MSDWQLRNCDIPLNRLKDLDDAVVAEVGIRFTVFLRKLTLKHPCSLRSSLLTKIGFDGDGDRFMLMLPHDWYVVFRVVPDCQSQSGIVEFIETAQVPSDLSAL